MKVDDALTDTGPTDAIRVAPQAVRGERLDWLLILNRRHLERVLGRVGALALSIWGASFVPCMIRGIGDRGQRPGGLA